jgi:hypothetical protein
MTESQNNSELNLLLINLGRSLLQYVEACSPWSGDETQCSSLDALVMAQKDNVARFADLLNQRRWNIDFGSFPTEYSDLHFVAIDYLLLQLVENQDALVTDIEQTQKAAAGDAPALELLSEILSSERDILTKLKGLSKSRSNGSAA